MSGTVDLAWADGAAVHMTWDDDEARTLTGDESRVADAAEFLARTRSVFFPSVGLTVQDCHAETWEFTVAACTEESRARCGEFTVAVTTPDDYETVDDRLAEEAEDGMIVLS
ncbi:MAG: hypothetical protein WCS88_04045 [Patescibacteria group bacterium]|jgi:hypothetical protein